MRCQFVLKLIHTKSIRSHFGQLVLIFRLVCTHTLVEFFYGQFILIWSICAQFGQFVLIWSIRSHTKQKENIQIQQKRNIT